MNVQAARLPPLEAGRHYPLGATLTDEGIHFAVFSAHAERVDLCVFDDTGNTELARLPLPACTDQVWHGFLPGARPGLVYGYRVQGPYDPSRGLRFNPHKLLCDPYARQFVGRFRWCEEHFGYDRTSRLADLSFDARDNAHAMLKSRVAGSAYDWEGDHAPRTAWADSVIYEMHVKGYSRLNAAIPAALQGTYAGLAHPASIEHLRRLGITAVELLPVHEMLDEYRLVRGGLVNYWGYNSIGFFAPAARYAASSDPLREFRDMVKSLHAAGIEVILDVVYNHSAESDELGPTLSLRGLDNPSYYRLNNGRCYDNLSGCGNTLNLAHPRVLQLVMDSLRWWVTDMHVDGFRFDLATALARDGGDFDPGCAFLDTLRQDPVLAPVKLIAEPWDVTTCRTGGFPAGMAEWNDRFRDTARRFWLTGVAGCGELATRLAASSDLFRHDGRAPQASINFVTAHDGFTLADLVSYRRKHNEANGQGNADGHDDNHSIDCGIEGPSDDPAILTRRASLQRALLATLLLAQGVPMLSSGDEWQHSQQGNNNAYCQDGPLTWLDWNGSGSSLRPFIARLTALRAHYQALRRTRWFDGNLTATGERDVTWLACDGNPLSGSRWDEPALRCFGMQLGRETATEPGLLILINGGESDCDFVLPRAPSGEWRLQLDTAAPDTAVGMPCHGPIRMPAHALLVLDSTAASA